MYNSAMEVAVSALRAKLGDWLDLARAGHEVVITDRGIPIARLVGVTDAATIERLTAEGAIARPQRAQRPAATGSKRVRARRPVSEIVSEQRR